MLLNVTIKDPTLKVKSGEKNGRAWERKSQFGFVELNGEVRRVEVSLRKDALPYVAGKYTCDLLGQVRVGKYDALEMDDRLVLVAVK